MLSRTCSYLPGYYGYTGMSYESFTLKLYELACRGILGVYECSSW